MSRTNELESPVVWPGADWELINWIVDRGTLPLEDLKPQYFRRPGDNPRFLLSSTGCSQIIRA